MSDQWTIQYVGSSDVRIISEDDIRKKLNVPFGHDLVMPRGELVEITPLLAEKLMGQGTEWIVRPPAKRTKSEEPAASESPAKKTSGRTRTAPAKKHA